jgi:hypothetical protein
MTILSLAFALVLAVDLAPKPEPATAAEEHAKKETRCGACHTAEGWDRVTFDHARTGFPLDGQHRQAECRGCHAASDFKKAVPRACVACHRDAHAGRLGTRCQNCHDAVAWKETIFGPEAHRRTNFPLDGRHAVLPCEECHGDRRDRGFSRPTRRCVDCHQADLLRATAVAFDHSVFGPSPDCRPCHGAWRFNPAYFAGHDTCFPIRSGTHSGIRCLRCHTTIPTPLAITGCLSGTAGCTRCHPCSSYQGRHSGVSGFSSTCPGPEGCYGGPTSNCHPSGSAGGG